MIHRRDILYTITCLALFGLLLVVVFGDNGWLELSRMRATHARLIRENENLVRLNLQTVRTIDRLQNDPKYIENIARRELGMIRGDELVFIFRSDQK